MIVSVQYLSHIIEDLARVKARGKSLECLSEIYESLIEVRDAQQLLEEQNGDGQPTIH